MLCLNNDSKMKMRLNIKRHRQKLLQYLENTNDTVLKPKIKSISNDIKKSNFNNNVKTKTKSSISVKQLQPNVKVNIQEEPLLKVELKQEPLPNIEIKDPKHLPVPFKKLKEQLIEELFNSSSSDEFDDNNEDWNELYQTHNENESSNSRIIKAVEHDEHKQLANEKSIEEYMDSSSDSNTPVLDINNPTTKNRSQTGQFRIERECQFQSNQSRSRFKTLEDKIEHNAKERKLRDRLAQHFTTLRKCCTYLNSNRREPSKHSILLAAKKECDLLKYRERKMLAEKKICIKVNESLINELNRRLTYSNNGCR